MDTLTLDDELQRQHALLTAPTPYVRLDRPCTVGDGILALAAERFNELEEKARDAALAGRLCAFVPASGAASRMFAALALLRSGGGSDSDRQKGRKILDSLDDLAVRDEIEAALRERGLDRSASADDILAVMLDADGLHLPSRPKGLIPFHRYEDGARTAFEEHLAEAAALCADADGNVRAHFTIGEDARKKFGDALERARDRLSALGTFDVTFSVQDPATDTICVDPDGNVVLHDGRPLRRPGGHGALLRNLEQHVHDVACIKNIDNIVPDHKRGPIVAWRRRLVGLYLELEALVHPIVRGETDPERARPLLAMMGFDVPVSEIPTVLNRPIRVAGMVKNEGKPGGGPFFAWSNGRCTPQIVEASQVDPNDPAQQAIAAKAGWFNPVDLVCGLRDAWGRPWRLDEHTDPSAVIVTEKTHGTQKIRILEHPGLWNGGMASWMSLFVDIPASTFHPVKTIADLLEPGHR